MKQRTYIAVTVGPIYKTLQNARATRELWAGSYMFSDLMRQLCEAFRGRDVLLPAITDDEVFNAQTPIGFFPDQLIFATTSGEEDIALLKKTYASAINRLANMVANKTQASKEETKTFLERYFYMHWLKTELDETTNPVEALVPMLNSMELFVTPQMGGRPLLRNFMEKVNGSHLAKQAFGSEHRGFDPLLCISTRDLHAKFPQIPELFKPDPNGAEDPDDTQQWKQIRALAGKDARSYHKYVAIVHADGDNMGKVVKNLSDRSDFKAINAIMSAFAHTAADSVHRYGGSMVYSGGDDMLFFAPVASGKNNILTLAAELEYLFREAFAAYKTDDYVPTLSFGITITYYKFPLFEALERSRELLFQKAKTGTKNRLAIALIKHSGQTAETVVALDSPVFRKMHEASRAFGSMTKSETKLFMNFNHFLGEYAALLAHIARMPERLEVLMRNRFNKEVHDGYKPFIDAAIPVVHAAYAQSDAPTAQLQLETLFRLTSLIRGARL